MQGYRRSNETDIVALIKHKQHNDSSYYHFLSLFLSLPLYFALFQEQNEGYSSPSAIATASVYMPCQLRLIFTLTRKVAPIYSTLCK